VTGFDALLAAAVAESGVVGAQLSVVADGVVRDAATGVADAATGAPLTADMPLQVGSISKVWTAVAAVAAADRGLFPLDAPLHELVPAFAPADPRARAITAVHAMSMSSGLDTGPYVDGPRDAASVDRYLALVADDPLLFAPGTRFAYSGVGVVLLARALERVLGRDWADLVADDVLRPAGMHASSVAADAAHAPGYAFEDGVPVRVAPGRAPVLAPTGTTAVSTAHDLALLAGELSAPTDGALLSRDALALLHTPTTPVAVGLIADHWCVGPYARTHDGIVVAGHGGRWASGVCDVVWLPGRGVGYAVTTNTPSRAGALVHAIGSRLLPELTGVAGAWPAPVPAPGPGVAELAGEFESPAARFTVTPEGDGIRLVVRRSPRPGTFDAWGETDEALVRIGPRRFLPAVTGRNERRLQEVWFSDDGEFVYDGLAAGRRVSR
jgi:CubicO group peptidase (beta-lactamase class C family)